MILSFKKFDNLLLYLSLKVGVHVMNSQHLRLKWHFEKLAKYRPWSLDLWFDTWRNLPANLQFREVLGCEVLSQFFFYDRLTSDRISYSEASNFIFVDRFVIQFSNVRYKRPKLSAHAETKFVWTTLLIYSETLKTLLLCKRTQCYTFLTSQSLIRSTQRWRVCIPKLKHCSRRKKLTCLE